MNIRILAIETISFVVTSIRNEERFKNEADQLMEAFITLQNTLDLDDAQHAPILDFYCQLSATMKESFVKYMEHIYPKLLEILDIKVQFVSAGQTEAPEKKFQFSSKFDSKLFQIDHFTFDTAAVAIKTAACNTVFALSRNLHKEFFKYIPSTLPKIVGYFEETLSIISDKAIKSIKNMVEACEKEEEMVEVINFAFPSLLKVLAKYIETKDTKKIHIILKRMNKSLVFLTSPLLDQSLVTDLVDAMAHSLTVCESEKKEVMKKFDKLKDVDDEKREEIQEEYESVNDVMQIVMEIAGKLMEIYQDKIENLLANGVVPYYYNYMQNKNATDNEILYCVCLFVSFMDYCSLELFNKASVEILEYFINQTKNSGISTVQSAAYGIGAIAKRMNKNTFSQYKNGCLQILSNIITSGDQNSSEDQKVCIDNAIGAVGKIAIYQSDQGDKFSEEVFLNFLKFLPLKNDDQEAQAIHKMLLTEILNKNQFIISISQDAQDTLLKTLQNIKNEVNNNPDLEILDDKGKELMINIFGQN